MINIIEVALIGFLALSNFIKSTPLEQPQPTIEPVKYTFQSASEPTVTPASAAVSTIKPLEAPVITQITQATELPKNTVTLLGIDLTNWKLTLPSGSEKPTEIKQPELAAYKIDPWYVFLPSQGAARFRAAVNGTTTSGSKYPRSELREMTNNGTTNASWSSTDGTHTMTIDEAITAVPQTKKHVVAGQIHDADDDVIVIRLEYPALYVNVDGKNAFTLDSNYSLGKRFKLKFEVSNGQTKVYYNDSTDPVFTLDKSYSGAYFKAGAYTQSNCSKEPSSLCNDDNYGEVVIYNATVSHQ